MTWLLIEIGIKGFQKFDEFESRSSNNSEQGNKKKNYKFLLNFANCGSF